jgi:hypothetical protein
MTFSSGATNCISYTSGNSVAHDYDGSRYDFGILWISGYTGAVYGKFDMSTSTATWVNLVPCASTSCLSHYFVAAISNDKTKAYSLSTITDYSKTILWLAFDFADGSVHGSRHMTQTNADEAKTIVEVGEYVYVVIIIGGPKICIGRYNSSIGLFDEDWFCTSHSYARIPLGTNPNFDTDPRIHLLGQYGNSCVIVKTTWGK